MTSQDDTDTKIATSPIKDTQQTALVSLLHELRDIKDNIIKLDAKIDSSHCDLSEKVTDCKVLNQLITTQNDKIAKLYDENDELRTQNKKLESELLKVSEELLHLIVTP